MIRNLIPSFIFLLLITACAKDSLAPDESNKEEKQLLSLTVDGFSQDLLPFIDRVQAGNLSASLFSPLPSSGTNLSDYINTLEYKVYHKGNLVDSIRQYSDDPEFGKYENYFTPDGNPYNVFVAGAMLGNEGDIELRKDAGLAETSLRVLPESVDAFSFYNSYTVGAEPQTESIQLKRFVGRLEINFTEEIPHNAMSIEITIHNTAKYFMPVSERGYHLDPKEGEESTPHNTFKKILIKPEDVGRNDYSVNLYFILKSALGSEAEITDVTIRTVSDMNQKIDIKEVNNVVLQANMRTKLTGKIFSHHPNRTFDIELNSDWDSEVPEFRF